MTDLIDTLFRAGELLSGIIRGGYVSRKGIRARHNISIATRYAGRRCGDGNGSKYNQDFLKVEVIGHQWR